MRLGAAIADGQKDLKPPAEGNEKIVKGVYRLRIEKLLGKDTENGPAFFAEVTVLKTYKSFSGTMIKNGETKPYESHKPGDYVAWKANLRSKNGPSNVVQFFADLFNKDFATVSHEVTKAEGEGKPSPLDAATNEEAAKGAVQPCAGMEIDASVRFVTIKGGPVKGDDFAVVDWTHVAKKDYLKEPIADSDDVEAPF